MMSAMLAILVFLFLCWTLGWVIFFREKKIVVEGIHNSKDSLKPPTLSLIIPARNEALKIGILLRSIGNADVEVLVVNDGSTDATASLSESLGAKVLNSRELPEGWKGKPWACYQGAQVATGDWLLFLDADTELATDWFTKIKRILKPFDGDNESRKVALSWLPFHKMEKCYEHLSAVFHLTMAMGSGAFLWRCRSNLFGQSLVVSKKEFLGIGAHSLVKSEVLENFALSSLLWERGWKTYSFLGNGFLSMRMYPGGLKELWQGWRKSMLFGSSQTRLSLLLLVSLWMFGVMTVLALALFLLKAGFLPWNTWVLVYMGFALQIFIFLKRLGNYSWGMAMFFPVVFIFYQIVFFYSVLFKEKRIFWKGRPL